MIRYDIKRKIYVFFFTQLRFIAKQIISYNFRVTWHGSFLDHPDSLIFTLQTKYWNMFKTLVSPRATDDVYNVCGFFCYDLKISKFFSIKCSVDSYHENVVTSQYKQPSLSLFILCCWTQFNVSWIMMKMKWILLMTMNRNIHAYQISYAIQIHERAKYVQFYYQLELYCASHLITIPIAILPLWNNSEAYWST